MSEQEQKFDWIPYTFNNETECDHAPESDLRDRVNHLQWQCDYLQREHPLPLEDALVAIEREAAKCIAAIRKAEGNWAWACKWLEERENHD